MNTAALRPPSHLRLVGAPAPDPDRALAERLHRRDRTALRDLFLAHRARLRDAARPICGASLADDVVQDVFLIVSQRPSSLPLDDLGDYLLRLARSVARERATAQSREARHLCFEDLDAIARRRIPRPRRKPAAE